MGGDQEQGSGGGAGGFGTFKRAPAPAQAPPVADAAAPEGVAPPEGEGTLQETLDDIEADILEYMPLMGPDRLMRIDAAIQTQKVETYLPFTPFIDVLIRRIRRIESAVPGLEPVPEELKMVPDLRAEGRLEEEPAGGEGAEGGAGDEGGGGAGPPAQ